MKKLSVLVMVVAFLNFAMYAKDVSLEREYQMLALKYLPTLCHQKGTIYFPVHVCFDGDYLASNNRAYYDRHYGRWNIPWVYIHIILANNLTYIQYWYYYVYNIYFLDNHNDDWEFVTIVLNENKKPIRVRLGIHAYVLNYSWESVDKTISSIDHPAIYVDKGSHAMQCSPYWKWYDCCSKFTTWEELINKHCYTFLGNATYYYNGISVINASGYDLVNGDIRQVIGRVRLPSVYEKPDDSPFVTVIAPWQREIWSNPEKDRY